MNGDSSRRGMRSVRRLVFALLWLIVIDQFAPSLLRRFEKDRYEGTTKFRFENADLFGLGPLVSYLRENPHGRRRRIAFLGNSVLFGYGLDAPDAVPAQFQKLQPGNLVLNMAVNGSQLGSSYLIAKAMVDSVDTLFVQVVGEGADPMLPALFPVADADVRMFRLPEPDPLESRLRSVAGIWRMYALNYRFQAALLGTSTRQYFYFHRKDIGLRLLAPFYASAAPAPPSWPTTNGTATFRSPCSATPPTGTRRMQLRREHQLLWEFADLMRSRRKRVVFMQIDQPVNASIEGGVADFNATYAPFAELIIVSIDPGLKFDGRHVTPQGATVIADVLARHEMQRRSER
jgi:hypothetical protein